MVTNIKQYNPSVSAVVSDWQVIDASGQVLAEAPFEMILGVS